MALLPTPKGWVLAHKAKKPGYDIRDHGTSLIALVLSHPLITVVKILQYFPMLCGQTRPPGKVAYSGFQIVKKTWFFLANTWFTNILQASEHSPANKMNYFYNYWEKSP